ncbi:hypothetical protein HYI36_20240 [Bacillus sp. Gen3]|nr:hypothetical protein [Bacillus sp. Gen3]
MSYNSIIETNSADPGGGTVGGSKNGVKIVRPGNVACTECQSFGDPGTGTVGG